MGLVDFSCCFVGRAGSRRYLKVLAYKLLPMQREPVFLVGGGLCLRW